jgi:hypothetical protein
MKWMHCTLKKKKLKTDVQGFFCFVFSSWHFSYIINMNKGQFSLIININIIKKIKSY